MGIQWYRFHSLELRCFLQGCFAQIFQAQQLLLVCQTGILRIIQLNMYNFHKVRENNSESYFHHQCFDRADEEKLSEIKRKP